MRESNFFDFDNCKVKLAPNDLLAKLGVYDSWTDDNKVDLFECRVDVWMLGPAVLMLRSIENAAPPSGWCHAAYGMFGITLPYFEMIGKILNPAAASSGTASEDFNVGFCDVYPSFKPANGIYKDKILSTQPTSPNPDVHAVKEFRDRARNGLFHVGYTKNGLLIHGDNSRPDVCEQNGNYYVNVHNMPRSLVTHFPSLMKRIRSDSATKTQFLKYFDDLLK